MSKEFTKEDKNMKISEAWAVYTGGNIWIFFGKLDDGNYFLTDDYGATLVLDADPSDLDESTYVEWQDEHKISELVGNDRVTFCNSLVDWLLSANPENRGGITNDELKGYREYFAEEF